MNNSGPRYKRSQLERSLNTDVLWCVLLLFIMCLTASIGLYQHKLTPQALLTEQKSTQNESTLWEHQSDEHFKCFFFFVFLLTINIFLRIQRFVLYILNLKQVVSEFSETCVCLGHGLWLKQLQDRSQITVSTSGTEQGGIL